MCSDGIEQILLVLVNIKSGPDPESTILKVKIRIRSNGPEAPTVEICSGCESPTVILKYRLARDSVWRSSC